MSHRSFILFQILTMLLCFIGAFFVQWSVLNIFISSIVYYLMFSLGVSLMMHRFWAHKEFQFKSSLLEVVFSAFAIMVSRGSPLAWVHIHREHHAHADTDKDPHKPSKFKLFSFKTAKIVEFKPFIVRDMLTPRHKVLHERYWYFVGIYPTLLFCIGGLSAVYFAYLIPIVTVQIVQDLWNHFSHVDCGYINNKLKNNSRNVPWLWPLIFGEAWHNNHHANPRQSVKSNWWEFDPVGDLIKIISK